MEDKITKEWIRQCLFEYVGKHLDGMDGYFHQCWEDAKMFYDDIPDYDEWFEGCRTEGTVCDMIGEWWLDCFEGKEKEFKEFMDDIDFSGYVDKFKEDFDVNIVWVQHQGERPVWLRDKLDIEVNM